MNRNLVIVTITYSFDTGVEAVVFDNYEKACEYIKKDFESEKKIDIDENGWEIDEELSYCKEDTAVLATIYNEKTEITTWTIARVTDKR